MHGHTWWPSWRAQGGQRAWAPAAFAGADGERPERSKVRGRARRRLHRTLFCAPGRGSPAVPETPHCARLQHTCDRQAREARGDPQPGQDPRGGGCRDGGARRMWREPGEVGSAIAHAAATTADELGARVIIAFTESGTTALRCSKARPRVPVVAASPHPEVLRKTALYSGVIPLLVSPGKDTDQMVANATEAARESGLVRVGDTVVVVAGVPVGLAGQTNLLKVETV